MEPPPNERKSTVKIPITHFDIIIINLPPCFITLGGLSGKIIGACAKPLKNHSNHTH